MFQHFDDNERGVNLHCEKDPRPHKVFPSFTLVSYFLQGGTWNKPSKSMTYQKKGGTWNGTKWEHGKNQVKPSHD